MSYSNDANTNSSQVFTSDQRGNPNSHANNHSNYNPNTYHNPTSNNGNHGHTYNSHNNRTLPNPKKNASRRGVNSRSQSNTRTPVRLSTSATGTKPHLNRSKSSDGIVRTVRMGVNRNRSFNKLSGLQPLTKTLLNGSYPRGGGLAPLTKTVLNGSAKGMKKAALDHLLRSLKASSSAKALYGGSTTGLKTSGKRGRAILKLNEDTGEDYEDLSDNLAYEGREEEEGNAAESGARGGESRDPENESRETRETEDLGGSRGISEEGRETEIFKGVAQEKNMRNVSLVSGIGAQQGEKETASSQTQNPNVNYEAHTVADFRQEPMTRGNSADDSSALYGGSLLLSQSTGLTRKIGPISELYSSDSRAAEDTGLSFAPMRPTTTEGTIKNESYQPNQTIFSNLQRTNTQFLNNMMQNQPQAADKKPATPLELHRSSNSAYKDFSSFLKGNQTPLNATENRTQQRLWLQRENSMMEAPPADMSKLQNFSSYSLNKLMFAYNQSSTNLRDSQYVASSQQNADATPLRESPQAPTPESVTNLFYMIQGGQNSIQSRTEFERLNRGYVNVRRHTNPVAESLDRLRKHRDGELDVNKRQNKKNGYSQAANTFSEYYPKWEEKREWADATINQMWQSALISSSASTASLQLLQQDQRNLQAGSRQSYTNTPGRPVHPMTRAAKLAAQAATGSQK